MRSSTVTDMISCNNLMLKTDEINNQKKNPKLYAIQGRMWKKDSNIFKGWLPKHIVLKDRVLKYYNIKDNNQA